MRTVNHHMFPAETKSFGSGSLGKCTQPHTKAPKSTISGSNDCQMIPLIVQWKLKRLLLLLIIKGRNSLRHFHQFTTLARTQPRDIYPNSVVMNQEISGMDLFFEVYDITSGPQWSIRRRGSSTAKWLNAVLLTVPPNTLRAWIQWKSIAVYVD